jgi:hypothetical protein
MLKDSSMCSDDNDSHFLPCFVFGVQGGSLDLHGRDR